MDQLMFSWGEPLASHFRLRDYAPGYKTPEETLPSSSAGSSSDWSLELSYGKTCREFCHRDKDGILVPSSGRWKTAGIVSPSECSTRSFSECPSDAVVSSLSDILEDCTGGGASARKAASVLFDSDGVCGHSHQGRSSRTVASALTARGVGTCGADDVQAQANHLIGLGLDERALGHTLTANGIGSCGPDDYLIPFDTTQLTSGANRSHPRPGDPCHPLASGAHPPAIAHTLRGDGFDASEDGTGRGTPIIPVAFSMRGREGENTPEVEPDGLSPALRAVAGGSSHTFVATHAVRRITPREAERLQGLPDDWTLVPYRGRAAADGPRYKAIGNSMAVPVVAWIGRRLLEAL